MPVQRAFLNLLVGPMISDLLFLLESLDGFAVFFLHSSVHCLSVFFQAFSANLCLEARIPKDPRFLMMFSVMFNSSCRSFLVSSFSYFLLSSSF